MTTQESEILGLWNIADAEPDRIALVDPSGREVTYRELATLANRYATGLRDLGLRTGDVLVSMVHNCVEAIAAYFAAYQSGLYIVAVNWHLTGPEVAYILSDSEAKAFFADERFAAAAEAAADEAGLPASARFSVGEINGFTPLSELGNADAGRPDDRTTGAPMLYTSGTTGRPKGVRRPLTGADPDVVSPANTSFFALFGLQPYDDHVHICGSPLYHTAVLNFATISIQLGHKVVLMDKWDAEEMLRLIEKHRVTHSHMVPTQFHRLLALPGEVRAKYDVSSLRSMVHGAAPCPEETKRRMLEWWGPTVTEYYAATEGGGTVISGAEWLRKPGSVGKAWPYSVIKVLSEEDGSELPPGETGLVYMKMGASSFEYHHDKTKTEESRVGDLFTVGDIGYLDEDGYLYLCDRRSDLILSGGVNIYPAEIETVLITHPKVADVAVFGIPHEDWGQEVKAVVQPAEGVEADAALTEELLAFAATRLAKYKMPRSIDYLDELPRDPNGKLYKRKLRERYVPAS
ncbi:acyl-CoA synthetase [Nocardia farcinica]|uniref:acyl-CoA synthetase n=1 Tax=Nocardia farcinica TaxID=37329 RepID=UPI001893B22E|nr:acyl-CoA synthetase [Nocardia farcinica]MBF6262683.1 acyl-CoA synthetase [Nocardia farcinica]MBF6281187.1 acyl-CoA synthetase [Nocardia farcinica]MBF6293084.1 acyl-CoA synthetase [Nocardia farcinica]MBF6306017.1 acyl-CoA synthetase [Nocardia farcinica]MBF6372943.1 acyl-CoA synthetase [Nocardia farcinica]